jgi:hypothetical protein
MSAYTETKVNVCAAVHRSERMELERRAREGDRTLSQEVRKAIRLYLERDTNDEIGDDQ